MLAARPERIGGRIMAGEGWEGGSRPPMALITGASSGIGEAFARLLSREGFALLLVARRRQRLEALARQLDGGPGREVEVFAADLALPKDLEALAERVAGMERLDLLVNNAGFGTTAPFAETDPPRQEEMIRVHLLATLRLCRAALPGMMRRRRGGIINVSSVAGFIPSPGSVTYAASKAYLNSFSAALAAEVRGAGIRVQALCPGYTRTEFHDGEEFRGFDRSRVPRIFWMSAEQVVEASWRAYARGRVYCIPGLHNRLIVALAGQRLLQPLLTLAASRRRRRE